MKKLILKFLRQIFVKQKKEIPLGVEAAGLDMKAEKIAKELSDAGYRGPINLDFIKRIDQAMTPTFERVVPKKSADVLDLTGKKIDTSKPILGGRNVPETKKLDPALYEDRGKDVIPVQFSDNIVVDTIATIKSKKPIDAMAEANSVIGRKGKYKNLTPEQSKKILKDTEDHIFERDIPIDPEDFAHGGRTGSGLNYLLGEDDQNSRVPFKDGTKFNPKRRTVLKGIAALATLPVIGKYFKWAKPLAKSSKVLTSVPINNIDGMPLWFKPLVNKVIKEGDDATAKLATGERQVIHRDVLPDGDEVTVTQHLDNGNVDVSVSGAKNDFNISKTGHGEQPYTISYVKGETIIGKNNKPIKVKDKMETDEGYSYSTGPDRTDVDMDFDLVNFTEKTTKHDTSVLNSYATGKKIKSTKKAQPLEDMSPEGDWDDSLDFASGGRVSLSNGGIAGMLGE